MNKPLTPEQRERKNAYRREWRKSAAQKAKQRADNSRFRAKNPDYQKKWRASHPGRRRFESYRQRYGLTRDAFEALLATQGGRCGICRVTLVASDKGTHVDHDHATNRVRGVLCRTCNAALGMLGDSLDGLIAAVDYLKRGRA